MNRTFKAKSILLLLCMVCSMCFSASAVTLKQKNVFAFDIRVDATDVMYPVVSYKLNGKASKVDIEVYRYGALAKTVDGTLNAENEVTVPMSDVNDGTITFKVKATTATTVAKPTQIANAEGYADKYYKYWAPWGLAVNNCTESETFGQLIVCETRYYTTQTSATDYLSSSVNGGQGPMLYPYNAWFEPVKNGSKYGFNPGMTVTNKQYKQYNTSYTGSEYVASFSDVAFSDDGRLFVATADPYVSDVDGPIYEANPSNLNAAATPVFPNATANYSKTMAGAAHCVDVVGTGDNLKLAICTSKSGLKDYNAMVYTLGKNKTITSGYKQMNSPGTQSHQFRHRLAFDPDGIGLTVVRYNSYASSFRYHNSTTGANTKNTNVSTYNIQGISRNHDGTLMARQTKTNEITVYRCNSANGTESLETLYTFAPGIGTWINDISFDYADNLYCCSNSGEIVRAFQLPPLSGDSKVVTVPAPANQAFELVKVSTTDLYCATDWEGNGNWDPAAAHQMDYDKGIYSITLPAGVNQFKLSTKQGDWDTFNSDIYIVESNMVVGDHRGSKVYGLHQGSYNDGATDNIVLASASEPWKVYVNLTDMQIWAEQPLKLYVRGSMANNNWEAHSDWELKVDDKGLYKLEGVNLDAEHEWKIGESAMSWNKYNNYDGEQDGYNGWERHNYGGLGNLKANRTKTLTAGGDNCSLDRNVDNATITYNHENKTIHVAHTVAAVRPGHAYDYNVSVDEAGTTATVIFKSTAAGRGRVVLTPSPAESLGQVAPGANHAAPNRVEALTKDDVEIVEGENQVTFDVNNFEPGNIYNIAVEYDHADNHAFEVVASYNGESTSNRGGVAVIKETWSPLFGYIVSSNGGGNGLWIHTPDFSDVKKYLNEGETQFDPANTVAQRISYYDGKVYISDQAAANGGIYVWDTLNPDNAAESIYENATYTTPWWKDATDNIIGGRSTSVKVVDNNGTPEVWSFAVNPPEWNGYHVLCSHLNENGKIDSAPIHDYRKADNYTSGKLGNQNVDMWQSKLHNGWWVCQERSNETNISANPSFMFVSMKDGSPKAYALSSSVSGVTGLRNAIALNEDESLLFYANRDNSISVCDVEWENDLPTVTFVQNIPGTLNEDKSNGGYYQFDFDPAGNLVAWGYKSAVKVIAIEQKARTKSMPAPDYVSFSMADGTLTSVKDIEADNTAETGATYYNLNGMRVAADHITPGVYVKVLGAKVSKVLVR